MPLPVSYSLRNLRARPGRSVMTASVIALVVVASSLFLGLISSLKHTIVSAGNPLNIVRQLCRKSPKEELLRFLAGERADHGGIITQGSSIVKR